MGTSYNNTSHADTSSSLVNANSVAEADLGHEQDSEVLRMCSGSMAAGSVSLQSFFHRRDALNDRHCLLEGIRTIDGWPDQEGLPKM